MDDTKDPPPKPLEPERPAGTSSYTPSKEALERIQRAALEMADRRRVRRPGQPDTPARTTPSSAEPPEPFFAPPTTATAPGTPLQTAATRTTTEDRLIAEFDSLVGGPPARTAAPFSTAPEPVATRTDPLPQARLTSAAATAALKEIFNDKAQITLTTVQSVGVAAAIAVLVMAAFALGAQTLKTANDWGCRTGLATTSCPALAPLPHPAMPPRLPEIPT